MTILPTDHGRDGKSRNGLLPDFPLAQDVPQISSQVLGRHILIDLQGCPFHLIDDVSLVREVLIDAANRVGAQIINDTFHRFAPQGVSGVIVIAESHLAIHTWPEFGAVAVDLFSCSSAMDLSILGPFLAQKLSATSWHATIVGRGGDRRMCNENS